MLNRWLKMFLYISSMYQIGSIKYIIWKARGGSSDANSLRNYWFNINSTVSNFSLYHVTQHPSASARPDRCCGVSYLFISITNFISQRLFSRPQLSFQKFTEHHSNNFITAVYKMRGINCSIKSRIFDCGENNLFCLFLFIRELQNQTSFSDLIAVRLYWYHCQDNACETQMFLEDTVLDSRLH